jgi:hypothetical protein
MPLIWQQFPQGAAHDRQALMRSIGLVRGKKIDIRPHRAHVEKPVRRVRYAIDTEKCTRSMGQGGDFEHRVDLSHHIRAMGKTDQTHVFVHQIV